MNHKGLFVGDSNISCKLSILSAIDKIPLLLSIFDPNWPVLKRLSAGKDLARSFDRKVTVELKTNPLSRYREMLYTLFNYSLKQNLQLLEASRSLDDRYEIDRLLSHIAWADHIWLLRVTGKPYMGLDFWKLITEEEMRERFHSNHAEWQSYLRSPELDLSSTLKYTDSRGGHHENTIEEIIYHVVLHSQHHRAQISTLIRQHGGTPPGIDFILYLRKQKDR